MEETAKTMNFAVKTTEDVVQMGNAILERIRPDGGNKADALRKLFELAAKSLDDRELDTAGADMRSLEASFENIRALYTSAVRSREEIVADRDNQLESVKSSLSAELAAMRAQRDQYMAQAKEASAREQEAISEAAKAKEAQAVSADQVSTLSKLLHARDEKISSYRDMLDEASEKSAQYDALKTERDQLARELSDARHELEMSELRTQIEVQKATAELSSRIAGLEMQVQLLQGK